MLQRTGDAFGAQCMVVAIDARTREGGWEVVIDAGRTPTGLDVLVWAEEASAKRGAGEILLTSIDRDGTGSGFDLELVSAVSGAVGVPVVASGGAGTAEHFGDALQAGADAVLGASRFHFQDLSIRQVKEHLRSRGMKRHAAALGQQARECPFR